MHKATIGGPHPGDLKKLLEVVKTCGSVVCGFRKRECVLFIHRKSVDPQYCPSRVVCPVS